MTLFQNHNYMLSMAYNSTLKTLNLQFGPLLKHIFSYDG